ncbi:hypothetical protein PM082_021492 [Marasmius tenuissimus]|nr:hypothetical protein PM082_021492 [Marasmius tenuissimus]
MRVSPLILFSPVITLAAPSAERITQLFAPLATGDGNSLVDLFSPNITWTTIGGVVGGARNYTETLEFFASVNNAIDGTYKVETVSVISEGAEGKHSSTELKAADGTVGTNGVWYDQRYVWVSEWDGEKMVSNREYLDSALADRLFGANSV